MTGGTVCGSPAARLDLELAAGTYFVEVSDSGNDDTGVYILLYQPIVVASAVPLVADVPVWDTLSPYGDLDLFTFTLTTLTRVVLQATRSGGFALPCVRLLTGPGGPPVTGGTVCGFPVSRLDLVLEAGTYFVEVSASGNTVTGAYSLLYQPIAGAVPLVADVPVSDTISPVGDLDLFTFTLTTSTRVVLQATGTGGFVPCLRLLPGPAPLCTSPARLDLVLEAGTYFVEVYASGNNTTGPYTLLYQPIVVRSASTVGREWWEWRGLREWD